MYCGPFSKHFNFWVEFDPMGVSGNFSLCINVNSCFMTFLILTVVSQYLGERNKEN